MALVFHNLVFSISNTRCNIFELGSTISYFVRARIDYGEGAGRAGSEEGGALEGGCLSGAPETSTSGVAKRGAGKGRKWAGVRDGGPCQREG